MSDVLNIAAELYTVYKRLYTDLIHAKSNLPDDDHCEEWRGSIKDLETNVAQYIQDFPNVPPPQVLYDELAKFRSGLMHYRLFKQDILVIGIEGSLAMHAIECEFRLEIYQPDWYDEALMEMQARQNFE